MLAEIVTYSPSLTLPLTRACINRCLYCGYRAEGDGLLGLNSFQKIMKKAHQEKVSEILILSGEKADRAPRVRRDLDRLGMDSLVSWAVELCNVILNEGLLPHVNIGTLDVGSLSELREVSASMGLMIEGVNAEVNARINPGKDLRERIRTIEAAGELQIPFTTGILLGVGENQNDRLASVLEIERIQREYGHIQEVILQKYVPNKRSRLALQEVPVEEMKELILFCKVRLPGVSIQVPPNLDSHWEEWMSLGADDLGGIGSAKDFVNPERPWPKIDDIEQKVVRAGRRLRKRLPIYPRFFRAGWYSERVGKVLTEWIEGNHEYSCYTQRSIQGQNSLAR